MSLGQVVNPYAPIVGLTGAGLNGGNLYIGIDGMDPQTNPQACYWDAAGTIVATQPIDILGGYPMRLGTPAQVFTAATYSIRVTDRLGVQVFYLASGGPAPVTAADVNYDPGQTGDVTRTVQARLRDRYSVADFGATTSASAPANATALQGALTFARTSNRRVQIPGASGPYDFSSTLVIENVTYTDGGMIVEGDGWGSASLNNGSTLRYTGAGAAMTMTGTTGGGNQDGGVEFRTFALVGASGASGDTTGAGGFTAERVNQASFHDVMSSYSGTNGMLMKYCYSSAVYRGQFFSNFESGITYLNAANRVTIQEVSAFKNGRSKNNPDQANVRIYGDVSYAPRICGADVSYSGRALFTWPGGGETLGRISSYNVVGGTATVVTVAAHTLTTGDRITVINATSATVWDAKFGRIVTVVNATTFTFPTGASNGGYTVVTDPALTIGTYSAGLLLGNAYGALVEGHYCEVPHGPSMYIGAPCRGLSLIGGYNQDAWLVFDTARNALVAGMVFTGYGGLSTIEADDRPTIDVHESNIFLNGAHWEHGPYYMKNGQRYGPAIPATGNWERGDILWNSAPSVGSPMGWQCVAAGTPGTWGTMPNLV